MSYTTFVYNQFLYMHKCMLHPTAELKSDMKYETVGK